MHLVDFRQGNTVLCRLFRPSASSTLPGNLGQLCHPANRAVSGSYSAYAPEHGRIGLQPHGGADNPFDYPDRGKRNIAIDPEQSHFDD
jgi:hypothetical protein